MDLELEQYKKNVAGKSLDEYYEIRDSLDRDKYPERYNFILQCIFEKESEITPSHIEDIPLFASRIDRLSARILDGLIFFPFGLYPALIYSSVPIRSIVIAHIVYMASSVYFIFFHAIKGASIGKKQKRIKVVDINGKKISWKSSVIRDSPRLLYMLLSLAGFLMVCDSIKFDQLENASLFTAFSAMSQNYPGLIKFLSSVLSLWAVADLFSIFFNRKNRTLHDMLAGTYVVNDKEGTIQGPL